jgi:Hypothetical protein (DUF2513)
MPKTKHNQLVYIVALDPNGRVIMTRDMELIRKILIEIRSRKDTRPRPVTIDGANEAILARHLELLNEAGLIDTEVHKPLSGEMTFLVKDLTWAGHDFVAVLENESVWSKIKEKFSAAELATLPLAVLRDSGVALLGLWAKSKLGLP